MRVLLVDDHAMFRRGVRDLLLERGVSGIDESESGGAALDRIRNERYDAVLLDVSLPDRDGLDILKQIKALHPAVPVLMLSMHAEEQFALRALKAGASGYLTKGAGADQLWAAFSKVVSGGTFVTPSLAERLASGVGQRDAAEPHQRLSDREFQVFRAIASGAPARQIAAELGLSVKTVNTHRMNVLSKLGLKSNAEIIRYAIDHGLA